MYYVGADGCKGGWFTVKLDEGNDWSVNVFKTIKDLWQTYGHAKLILIDMPIGLRDTGNMERICDKEARKLLGHKRGSSVFPVPCRAAVYAEPVEKAGEVNRQNTGRGLSRQTLGIIRKIREVDHLLLTDIVARLRIREVHPEVCFWVLNNCQPMRYSKKTVEGFEERMVVLRSVYPYTEDIVKYCLQKFRRKEVAKDDILDALVAAVTTSKEGQGLSTIPEKPEVDSEGLPMEMVYIAG